MRPTTWWQRAAFCGLLAVALWAFFYRLGAVPLLDDPNEGEHAEVAREMVESGEWVSPQLNYALFLDKPVLETWLIAVSDLAVGTNELAARLPSAVAGLVIVMLVVSLGTTLFDVETGLLAGFILAAMGGFVVATHEARPDLILTAGLVGALVALVHLLRVPSGDWNRRVRLPLLGWQLSLAIGVLAGGMCAVLLPGLVCAAVIWSQRRFDLVTRLLHPRAWWLLVLLVVPWHVVISLRHPGFAWECVVNQPMRFFDGQVPHDAARWSSSIFWAAPALRLAPWTIFVPLSVVAVWQRVRRQRDASGDRLLLAWLAAALLLAMVSSRLDECSILALPAFALALARMFREYTSDRRSLHGRAVSAHVVAFAGLAAAGPFLGPQLVAAQRWLVPAADFATLARTACTLLAVGTLVAAAAALAGWRAWVVPVIVATFVAAVPLLQHGLTMVARGDSSAPIAAAVRAFVEPQERLVFEAPPAYQQCAGLNFYLRRQLDLLEPAHFVPPPYLQPHVDDLFISRERLVELWENERVYFMSDPLIPRRSLDGVVPQPIYIVVRDNRRWLVTNRPFH